MLLQRGLDSIHAESEAQRALLALLAARAGARHVYAVEANADAAAAARSAVAALSVVVVRSAVLVRSTTSNYKRKQNVTREQNHHKRKKKEYIKRKKRIKIIAKLQNHRNPKSIATPKPQSQKRWEKNRRKYNSL